MQYLASTLILCLTLAFASSADLHASASTKNERMIIGFSKMFSISRNEVEACVHKTKVTFDDMDILVNYVYDETENANKDSIRRASCTLTCCAQAQGTMTGANFNAVAIHNEITNSSAPQQAKSLLHIAVDACVEFVKDVNDECDKGLQFLLCLTDDKWGYKNY